MVQVSKADVARIFFAEPAVELARHPTYPKPETYTAKGGLPMNTCVDALLLDVLLN